MTAVGQLDYVDLYSARWRAASTTSATSTARSSGRPASARRTTALFKAGGDRPKLYLQNEGLDLDHDGDIPRSEMTAKVRAFLAEGHCQRTPPSSHPFDARRPFTEWPHSSPIAGARVPSRHKDRAPCKARIDLLIH
jgi:hypothetical protein